MGEEWSGGGGVVHAERRGSAAHHPRCQIPGSQYRRLAQTHTCHKHTHTHTHTHTDSDRKRDHTTPNTSTHKVSHKTSHPHPTHSHTHTHTHTHTLSLSHTHTHTHTQVEERGYPKDLPFPEQAWDSWVAAATWRRGRGRAVVGCLRGFSPAGRD